MSGAGGTNASAGMGGRGGTGGSENTGGTSGQGGATCMFGQEYSFTIPNGTRGYFYRMQASVALTRIRPGSDVGNSCSVPLPTCNSPTTIDASDIIADIADAEVQLALSTAPRPVYGDRSASSAPTFSFGDTTGAASGGFSVLVGHECSTATATCEPTPAGVARLVADVNTVVSAALLDPSCASLR
jgi:hypothetical protein